MVTCFFARHCCRKLPGLLKETAYVFTDRERDVYITGALGILSGCLPGIEGCYDGKVVYPNLFTFIVAPAGNGKGALNFAKELGMKYHIQLLEENEKNKQIYQVEIEQ